MQLDRHLLKTIFSIRSLISLRPYWYSYAAKRLMDILAAILGLLLLAPFFAWIAILIKRDSPGPVFYRGPRDAPALLPQIERAGCLSQRHPRLSTKSFVTGQSIDLLKPPSVANLCEMRKQKK